MKSLLVCPAERPAVARLAERTPLVAAPLLGRSALEYWVESLAARGAREIIVLASDRPQALRALLGDGARWGARIELIPTPREYTPAEARARHGDGAGDWLPDAAVVVVDHLPGRPDLPLFESYAGWFAALRAWMPSAVTPGRIGVREREPGVWIGLRAEIAPGARLTAPCWIGDHVRIADGAQIGPGAILDDRVVVDHAARVIESAVDPDTYVGELVSVTHSLARGGTLVNWRNGSSVEVPDPFLLSPLSRRRRAYHGPSLAGRLAAALVLLAISPFALAVIAWSLLRGEAPWQLRLALRPGGGTRPLSSSTFAYYELTSGRNWLRRWPQLWSVVRGDLTWIGNRPLRPSQALNLTSDFERLWLAAPVGLISLADARGCADGLSDEACAHASFYAVNAGRRLDWFVFSRALLRAAMAWPIWGQRRREAAVPLERLATKQEL